MKNSYKGILMLTLTAFIWGISFVSQSVGMDHVEGFTFNGIRTLMGAFVLLPYLLLQERNKIKEKSHHKKPFLNKATLFYGTILGVIFCVASNFQQFAFNYSTSGKIAFVTSIYIFFVPLFGLFLKKRVSIVTWVCVLFGFIGLYFLCIDSSSISNINKGDILAFICAIIFALHILFVEKFSPQVDGPKLAFVQFFVSGTLSCILMFLFETPSIVGIKAVAMPLLYSGILSCGVAYTFQIMGQKYTEATIASLIMCTESVFAVLAAAILLHEVLSEREIIGCIIMFAAILFSQISEYFFGKEKEALPE